MEGSHIPQKIQHLFNIMPFFIPVSKFLYYLIAMFIVDYC